jgi:uncharacterized protein YndB with AHSA1/START domain
MTSRTNTHADTFRFSTPTDREFRTERVFAAPRELVWRAFTEPELVAQWFGRGNRVVIEQDDVAPGGRWRYVEYAPDGVHGFEGRYREVIPPQRIVRTFDYDGMPGRVSIETIEFEDLGSGLTKVVSVSLFLTTAERDAFDGMDEGVRDSYAALDRLLERLQV